MKIATDVTTPADSEATAHCLLDRLPAGLGAPPQLLLTYRNGACCR